MVKLAILVLNFLLLSNVLADSRISHMQVSFTVLPSSSMQIKQEHGNITLNNTTSFGVVYRITVQNAQIKNKDNISHTGNGQSQSTKVVPENNKTIIIQVDF